MDSMRSLGTSLPGSPSKGRQDNPPEHLLQAFRSAALSVTTLYKTAASEQAHARQAGYQDALDDLLGFLDRGELGFGDGEGWKVRQWATERLEGGETGGTTHGPGESEDEKVDNAPRARSSSPAVPKKDSQANQRSATPSSARPTSPARTTSAPPSGPSQQESEPQTSNQRSGPFTFRSNVEYPQQQDADMDASMHEGPGSASHGSENQTSTQTPTSSTPSVRLEVVPRSSRNKRGNLGRLASRSSNQITSNLASKSGMKRRLPFEEFFDIRDLGNGKDNHPGAPKRGRYS
ncbi:MAG: hypothetical protein M4579_002723 [Chaenotheca gracillima]|nr:MAG: hypothetical protein M4579_002723 [Chaenotheca gracillima]